MTLDQTKSQRLTDGDTVVAKLAEAGATSINRKWDDPTLRIRFRMTKHLYKAHEDVRDAVQGTGFEHRSTGQENAESMPLEYCAVLEWHKQ